MRLRRRVPSPPARSSAHGCSRSEQFGTVLIDTFTVRFREVTGRYVGRRRSVGPKQSREPVASRRLCFPFLNPFADSAVYPLGASVSESAARIASCETTMAVLPEISKVERVSSGHSFADLSRRRYRAHGAVSAPAHSLRTITALAYRASS
jgi:hypothetical protein